ncbi:MAG: hypothetical protein ACFFB3_06310 [Candidatus Hodarchaeota archaeon]
MEKPSLLNSQIFDYWVASCDIGSIGLAICTGPQFKLLNHSGNTIWEKTLGGSTSMGFFSKYGPRLVVGCWDGAVREFDFEGRLLKEITFSYPVYSISETILSSPKSGLKLERTDSIIACVGQHVVALNPEWREEWRFKMPFYIKSCDIGREGQLVVGAQAGPTGGVLIQLDADGKLIWRKDFSTNVLVTRYIEHQNEDYIVFGTRGGAWGIVAGKDGAKLHSAKLKGSVLCAEKAPGGLLLGGRDKMLRNFEFANGKVREIWKYKFSDVVYCFSLKNIDDVNVKLLVGTLDHQLHFLTFGETVS